MNSRTAILQAIRDHKPADRPLPDLPPDPDQPDLDIYEAAFREVLAASKTTFLPWSGLPAHVAKYADETVVSTVANIAGNLDIGQIEDPLQLAGVELAVLSAQVGVAENGAMWVSEKEAVHRVLPFITQHLILVLDRRDLVGTMHEAYRRIQVDRTGFGVFVAGPSKTADIEQSLVIGAHGPRSLVVCFREK